MTTITITLPRATVEQALEAICSAKLCEFNSMSSRREMVRLMDEAITALRAALAQQAEPWERRVALAEQLQMQQAEPVEPVAWAAVTENGKLYKAASTKKSAERKAEQQEAKFGDTWKPLHVVPLYTAPPQRKPLTDEEIAAEWQKASECASKSEGAVTTSQFVQMFARAVERAHNITDPQVEDRLARHGILIPMPEGDPK